MTAHLCFVRPSGAGRTSRAEDIAAARELPRPAWVILLGAYKDEHRLARHQVAKQELKADAVQVWAPVQVTVDSAPSTLARDLAAYLLAIGFRQPLLRHRGLTVHLPRDFDLPLLSSILETASAIPAVDVEVGEHRLTNHLPWQQRRDQFLAPYVDIVDHGIVGQDSTLLSLIDRAKAYARLPYPVLILGETGTGKELFAKLLHDRSGRAGQFMPTNAANLDPELAESLLFGHTEGAFTGATRNRDGRIRETDGGTLFLDEAFDLHPSVQAKLLRTLNRADEGILEVTPLGSTEVHRVNARLVVSAQSDPRSGDGGWRSDLYFRVAAGMLELPPLRHRREDIPRLGRYLLERAHADVTLADSGADALQDHDWPGNIRELRMVLLRAVMDCPPRTSGGVLDGDAVRRALNTAGITVNDALPLPCHLKRRLCEIEVATLRAARDRHPTNTDAGRAVRLPTPHNFGRDLKKAEANLARMRTADVD